MNHADLFESSDDSQGHRYLTGAPGIYVHKTGTREKAENYIHFMPLCDDGVFWGCKWEVNIAGAASKGAKTYGPMSSKAWFSKPRGTLVKGYPVRGYTTTSAL